ncbi:hypothetical protein CRG98_030941 [Punica granatum]|uniref:Uncharacterized protein n=1 Tax=Punica granatum TaxID=22663 RepID=A0A2I0IXD0_PUNGR|nr:hypothetical protein CRG98_030941 [Punica granatum]
MEGGRKPDLVFEIDGVSNGLVCRIQHGLESRLKREGLVEPNRVRGSQRWILVTSGVADEEVSYDLRGEGMEVGGGLCAPSRSPPPQQPPCLVARALRVGRI